MKFYELPCYDRQSFQGRAHVIENDDGTRTLASYNTLICRFNPYTHELEKLDPTATNTTRRHISAFLRFCGIPDIRGRKWDSLPLHTAVDTREVCA